MEWGYIDLAYQWPQIKISMVTNPHALVLWSDLNARESCEHVQMRGFINHEYLVLELQEVPTDKLYILAEKTGGEDGAGITVQMAEPADFDLKQVVLHFDCGWVAMNLDSLQKLLLEADTPHYDLQDHNCWDYATSATKRVLMECIAKVSGEDEAKKAKLEKALQDLEANLNAQGIFNVWKKAVEWWANIPKKAIQAW